MEQVKINYNLNFAIAAIIMTVLINFSSPHLLAGDGVSGSSNNVNTKSDKRVKPIVRDAIELSYGSNTLQKIDYWRPATNGAPLIIFVHGGAWMYGDKRNATGKNKIRHYLQQGYAFASVNYRLLPDCTVEQQAQDVTSALAYLISHAETLGFDPKRVVMMGHSAGAHLSALIGTDMRYLKEVGSGHESLRGVVLLDGAAYDVPRQIKEGGLLMRGMYVSVFGFDRERQIALSPTHNAAAPNVPAFLILHVQRPDGIMQSQALAKALKESGTSVEVHSFEGRGLTGHVEINNRLGDTSYPATPVVDEWLNRVFSTNK